MHGRDAVRPQYDRRATGYRFADRTWNGQRREYVGGEDGAWRGDRWVPTGAYRDYDGTMGSYGQPNYAYAPGAVYAYAPGYPYGPAYGYSRDYGPYEYGPGLGIGIGPVGIGIGPAWGW